MAVGRTTGRWFRTTVEGRRDYAIEIQWPGWNTTVTVVVMKDSDDEGLGWDPARGWLVL